MWSMEIILKDLDEVNANLRIKHLGRLAKHKGTKEKMKYLKEARK